MLVKPLARSCALRCEAWRKEDVIMLPPGRKRPASQDIPGIQVIEMRPEPGAPQRVELGATGPR
jgi:hypothetical protein